MQLIFKTENTRRYFAPSVFNIYLFILIERRAFYEKLENLTQL